MAVLRSIHSVVSQPDANSIKLQDIKHIKDTPVIVIRPGAITADGNDPCATDLNTKYRIPLAWSDPNNYNYSYQDTKPQDQLLIPFNIIHNMNEFGLLGGIRKRDNNGNPLLPWEKDRNVSHLSNLLKANLMNKTYITADTTTSLVSDMNRIGTGKEWLTDPMLCIKLYAMILYDILKRIILHATDKQWTSLFDTKTHEEWNNGTEKDLNAIIVAQVPDQAKEGEYEVMKGQFVAMSYLHALSEQSILKGNCQYEDKILRGKSNRIETDDDNKSMINQRKTSLAKAQNAYENGLMQIEEHKDDANWKDGIGLHYMRALLDGLRLADVQVESKKIKKKQGDDYVNVKEVIRYRITSTMQMT